MNIKVNGKEVIINQSIVTVTEVLKLNNIESWQRKR